MASTGWQQSLLHSQYILSSSPVAPNVLSPRKWSPTRQPNPNRVTKRPINTAKMLFWVRFVFRALSWRVRGTFYGYGQRDRGYLGRRTHPGGCAGVTVAVSHRSHGTYCQNAVLGAFCVPSSVVARPCHFIWIWPSRFGLSNPGNTL